MSLRLPIGRASAAMFAFGLLASPVLADETRLPAEAFQLAMAARDTVESKKAKDDFRAPRFEPYRTEEADDRTVMEIGTRATSAE